MSHAPGPLFSRRQASRSALRSAGNRPVKLRHAVAHPLPREAAALPDAVAAEKRQRSVIGNPFDGRGDRLRGRAQTYPTFPSGTTSARPPTSVTTIGVQNW